MGDLKEVAKAFRTRKQSFQLHYNVDYGIDRRTGWSVVVNGSVVVQFFDDPAEALEEALVRLREWESSTMTRANIEEIRAILEANPCHHRGPADCVLCDIRKAISERQPQEG